MKMNNLMTRAGLCCLLACGLLAGGCSSGNSPEGVVSRYFEAMGNRDLETVLKLVDWSANNADPKKYKVTELAFVRTFVKMEQMWLNASKRDQTPPSSSVFTRIGEINANLDKMVVENEKESSAEVACFQKDGTKFTLQVCKVDGTWKIQYDGHDNNCQVTVDGYDAISPFCSDVELAHYVGKESASAQGAAKSPSSGARSPKEAGETMLQALGESDLGRLYDLLSPDFQAEVGRDKFVDGPRSDPKGVEVLNRFKRVAAEAKIASVEEGGDEGRFTLLFDGKTWDFPLVRVSGAWRLSDISALRKMGQ